MASTYSTGLRLELPATGDKRGTWGTMANTGYQLIDDAVGGYVEVAMSDANTTLTASNGSSDQARNAFIKLTGALTQTREVVVPTAEKTWWVWNGTSGSQSVTVKTTAGTGVTIANGMLQKVAGDGTNVVALAPPMAASTGLLAAVGGGTGIASYAVGDILYAATTTTLAKLAGVATGNALISGGVTTAPAWGKVGLTTHVDGTLPVANGGTGATSLTSGYFVKGAGTSALTASQYVALAADVSGTLPVANGGTGATSLTSGYFLKGAGTSAVTASQYVALASDVSGTLPIVNGGTGDTTAQGGRTALLPTQSGQSGKFLQSNGTDVSWAAGTSLTYHTEDQSTSSPNNSVYASSFTALGVAVSIDVALVPKGAGAILAQVPTGTTGGGDKRGGGAVDFQRTRSASTEVASGEGAVLAGGVYNTASGQYSAVAGGSSNTASAYGAFVVGAENTANGQYSAVVGGLQATTRGIYGAQSHASGYLTTSGDAQTRTFVLRTSTNNATPAVITADNQTAGTTNQVVLPNDSTFFFEVRIAARRTDVNGESAAYILQGCIDRNSSAANTALVGSVTKTVVAEDTAGWDVAATADTVNGALAITVTGESAKNISWVAHVRTVEVVG
jgi:hypothetical protein